MWDNTRRYVDMFWQLVDEMLNAVLFVLIGLEVLLIDFSWPLLGAGALDIGVTLLSRWLTVGMPVAVGAVGPCETRISAQSAKEARW